ncbi:MAG: sulfatase family protein [Candidatus Nitrosopumilus sp. bin_32a]
MKPNILFLVIDSLRSDRFYGKSKTSVTPNIDKLIEKGGLFTNTLSSIPATKRATSSILTSLHPFKTGSDDDNFFKISDFTKTHFSTLKQNGYHVVATVPEVLSSTGLFSEIDNGNDFTFDNFHGRLNHNIDKKILNQLDLIKSKSPWIYYIHLLDLIKPVIVDDQYNKSDFGNDEYDRILSNIDIFIGKLIKKINLDETLIIITADHSTYLPKITYNNSNFTFEASTSLRILWKLGFSIPTKLNFFWMKLYNIYKLNLIKKINNKIDPNLLSIYQKRLFLNLIGHTRDIYSDNIVIPFLICGSHIKNFVSNFTVRQIDIFPTIFQIIGIKSTQNYDGISLKPILNGENLKPLICYIENLPTNENKWKKIIGVQYDDYKLVVEKNDPSSFQLYNLKNDPFEENDIAKNELILVKKMREYLDDILQNVSINPQELLSDSERKKVEDELKKLGYI